MVTMYSIYFQKQWWNLPLIFIWVKKICLKKNCLPTTFEDLTPPILQSGTKEAAIVLAVLIFFL